MVASPSLPCEPLCNVAVSRVSLSLRKVDKEEELYWLHLRWEGSLEKHMKGAPSIDKITSHALQFPGSATGKSESARSWID